MDRPSDRTEQRVKELFHRANETPIEPSPFLKTRVLAHVREERAKVAGLRWKVWAIASSAVSLVLFTVILGSLRSSLMADVGQKVLVRVEVQALNGDAVAYAKVELPEGLSFVSAKYPEIRDARELRLAWMPEFERQGLPVVVQAAAQGKKTIRILLLDHNNTVLKTKEVTIKFQVPA